MPIVTEHQDFMRPARLAKRNRRVLLMVAFLLFLLAAAATISTYHNALKSSEQTAASRLALQVESFTSALDKYRLLAPLLARRPDILAVFSSARDEDDLEAAFVEMIRISGMSDAAEIQLTFLDGARLSTSSRAEHRSMRASPERLLRPDIRQAMQGRLGRHFRDDGANQYFIFSSAARVNSQVAGIVSILVDLGSSQQLWALTPQPIIAAQGGIVLLSNREGWTQKPLLHGVDRGEAEGLRIWQSLFGPTLMAPDFDKSIPGSALHYVVAAKRDYVLGWTFYALEPLTRSLYAALLALLLASSISAVAIGALWIVFNRQVGLLRQRRGDMANSLWLERRVQSRTRELQKAQEDLVHSAKLAAIGQMSTVLSHEYNQPLMAIRSYSENAGLLFDAGREDKGQENLKRIVTQVDKLSKLSQSLKSFARRPGVDICAVSVNAVVDESVMIMTPRARKCGVSIVVQRPKEEVRVMAGHTRLEQVLVNLIANALDALEEVRSGRDIGSQQRSDVIRLSYLRREAMAVIHVSDTGPGIDAAIQKDIFEPFVTSKKRGVGLGLGLPIAYNLIKGFGGALRLVESVEAGMATTFEIVLPLAADGAELGAHGDEDVKPI